MGTQDGGNIRIERVEVVVYRAPIGVPVVNAFGTMFNRPAVIVRLTDVEGASGLGEIWCNFPTCGAEHRARLVESFLGPLLQSETWSGPEQAFRHLTGRARRLVLQAGEPGPLAQCIAGLDTALWDLVARKAGRPLWQVLRARAAEGGSAPERPAHIAEDGSTPGTCSLPAYASGLNPSGALDQALGARAAGYRAFKLKIGFGRQRDLDNLRALREALGPEVPIAVDPNQAWDLEEAIGMSREMAAHDPLWLEEPIAADAPDEDWQRLAEASPVPLAGGENLRGDAAFDRAIALGALRFLQPDLAKWGGLTACLGVARRALAAGRTYCPHYLGGGIGLIASAHLLAAAGGPGLLEVDSNPNPLRAGLAQPFPTLQDGRFVLNGEPGLGVAPGQEVERFRVLALQV